MKLDEVLAVETNHPSTLRATFADELDGELRAIRQRHGFSGGGIGLRRALYRARDFAWRRWAYLRFACNYLVISSSGRRSGPWANFISSTGARISWGKFPLALLPFGQQRFVANLVTVRDDTGLSRELSR